MGRDSNSVLQIAEDTSKGQGDRVRNTLRMLLTGGGVQGDGTLEGNEEALTTYTDDVVVNQLRHAVRSGGKMSEQRIPFSVREEARLGLQDWWADRIDTAFFNQIGGNAAQTDTKFTGNNATTIADSSHIIRALSANESTAKTADSSITTSASYSFSLGYIDTAVLKAKTTTPQVRPLKVNGEDRYVIFMHPTQVRQLRIATDTGQWLDIQKAAMQGGDVKKNPIFTGALGVYNQTILHESTRVPLGVDTTTAITNVRRAIFCGAQAACLAFGRGYGPSKMSWVEELFDYKNQLGVSAGMIWGLKKTIFNSEDFATIAIATWGATPA